MPLRRPPTTGYARLAQAEEHSDEEDGYLANSHASLPSSSALAYTSVPQPDSHAGIYSDGNTTPKLQRRSRHGRHMRRNSSGVDIKAINARLERWAEEITSKFKIKKIRGKGDTGEGLEIHHTVFQPPDGMRPASAAEHIHPIEDDAMTKAEFERIVESVRIAIENGMHPKMISQGSSGSYFARNSDGKVVGVFKVR